MRQKEWTRWGGLWAFGILIGGWPSLNTAWSDNEPLSYTGSSGEIVLTLGTLDAVAYSPPGNTIALAGSQGVFVWNTNGELINWFRGHTKPVAGIEFSQDGKWILTHTGSGDRLVKLWDAKTGAEIRAFPRLPDRGKSSVITAAISPDNNFVLLGDGLEAQLWNINKYETAHVFSAPKNGQIAALAFSPDGKQLLFGGLKEALLVDRESQKTIFSFPGHAGAVRYVSYSYDKKSIYTGSDDSVKIWNAANGKLVKEIALPAASRLIDFSPVGTHILYAEQSAARNVLSLSDVGNMENKKILIPGTLGVFSPQGKRVLIADKNGTATIYEIAKLKPFAPEPTPTRRPATPTPTSTRKPTPTPTPTPETSTPVPHAAVPVLQGASGEGILGLGTLEAVAYNSTSGNTIATAGSLGVFVWDTETGKPVNWFQGHKRTVIQITLSNDGQWALSLDNRGIPKLWETTSGKELFTFPTLTLTDLLTIEHSSLSISPDKKLILLCDGKSAQLWDVEKQKLSRTLSPNMVSKIYSGAFSPDGKQILLGGGKDAFLLDTQSGEVVKTFGSFSSLVFQVAFSPDGKRILTGSGNQAILWNVETGKQVKTFPIVNQTVRTTIAYSPNGIHILITGRTTTTIYEAETGKIVATFPGDLAAFSPQGKQVLTGNRQDGTVTRWELATQQPIRNYPGHSAVYSYPLAVFSPDGKWLLADNIRVWDAEKWKDIAFFSSTFYVGTQRADISPDGKQILIAQDETTELRDLMTGAVIHVYNEPANAVAFSPDGKQILSATVPKRSNAVLLDKETGKRLQSFKDFYPPFAFSPDGKNALSIGLNGGYQLNLWDLANGTILRTYQRSDPSATNSITDVAFSPNGKWVLAGIGNSAILWETGSGQQIRTFNHSGIATTAFSPDGQWILTAGGVETIVWDANTGDRIERITTLKGRAEFITNSAAFSPNGKWMVVASSDGAVRVWEVARLINPTPTPISSPIPTPTTVVANTPTPVPPAPTATPTSTPTPTPPKPTTTLQG